MNMHIQNITFAYNGNPVLHDITTSIQQGDFIALTGANGSGKSTLIKCINNILTPRHGTILLNEKNINTYPSSELARKIAYVPQTAYRNMYVTVFDMVLTGRKPYISWRPSKKDMEVTADIIHRLQIEHIAVKDFNKLSGGQQQIVCIARAIAQEPDILLLDEPTANLDIRHQQKIMNLLKGLTHKKMSVVIALHDINLALRYANKFFMLHKGTCIAEGGKEIITKENIEKTYHIKADIINQKGHMIVLPHEHIY